MDSEIYNKLSIINVKNKLGLGEICAKGDNIYVRCPFCSEKNESNMKLNVTNDSYYCRRCGESGFAIGLYARANYISNKTAYKRLLQQEADMTTELVEIKKSERRTDEEISLVYKYFLKMLGLTKKHYEILTELGFSKDEIIKYSFKSIPQREHEKVEICNRLRKGGLDLKGIPGFFINKQMKWTFKSHKGFFIPVIYNNRVNGLRVHLEQEYKFKTTDIWFSSSNEYRGANAKNNILILTPANKTSLELIDNDKKQEQDIIIASEMLLAYKAHSIYDKLTIGLPNTISKKQAKEILNNISIKKAIVFLDKHTMFVDPYPIYNYLLNQIDENKEEIDIIFNNVDMANIKNKDIIETV